MTSSASDALSFFAKHAFRLVLPCFLVAAIVLGGASRGGYLATGALEVAACLLLIWCVLDAQLARLSRAAWMLLGLMAAFLAVCVVELIPLPPAWWSALPGRAAVLKGFILIGAKPPALPFSLAPEETLLGLLRCLPPLAAFVLAAKLPWRAATAYLAWTLVIVAALTVGLGLAQIFTGGEHSRLYFYGNTNLGRPVGLMANVNHEATLLLMTLPFAAVLVARERIRGQMGDSDLGQMVMLATLGLTIAFGIIIAGSIAGYLLSLPALLLSMVVFRDREAGRGGALAFGGMGVVLALLAVIAVNSPFLPSLGVRDFSTGTMSRPDIYARTWRAVQEMMPLGSGLGSFEALFPSYEDPNLVTTTFANHAHNEYLELALELGLPGLLLLGGLLAWWVWQTVTVWRATEEGDNRLRKAATVAVGLVLLHSAVDYPVRTETIAVLAAICLGLMAASPQAGRSSSRSTRGSPAHRHVEL